ncbi:hypothetical protein [Kocuria sp.]|uniref:hypothetical protein n=1 Tax=Kocuria sp. TaxID=1871328 RepID=UPI0025C65475|nr:hypothetical protein [Kocuria sp.]
MVAEKALQATAAVPAEVPSASFRLRSRGAPPMVTDSPAPETDMASLRATGATVTVTAQG